MIYILMSLFSLVCLSVFSVIMLIGLGSFFGNDSVKEAINVAPTENVKVSSFDEPKIEVNRGGNTHVNVDNSDDNNGGGSIWKWLLPLLLLALAAWFLWKQCDKKDATSGVAVNDSAVVVQDSAVIVNDSANVATAAGSTNTKVDENIDLNGVALKGYKGGMEDQMITFLKAGSYKTAADDAALKDKWYTFDKVNFKIGSATELEAGSQVQMDNLLAILKAFPEAKVKIGGYTDKTGVEADNVKLSQSRADFIKNWLAGKGVGAQVLTAEGYGSKFATVAKEATNDERAVDRKMAVRFAK